MQRRIILFFMGVIMCAMSLSALAAPQVNYDSTTGLVTLVNGRMELKVETASGLNPNSLRDTVSGRVYADRQYIWPGDVLPTLVSQPTISTDSDSTCRVVFLANMGSLRIEQTFVAPANEPGTITETIKISNPGATTIDNSSFACGFGKAIHDGSNWLPEVANARFCNVPYRRTTETGELCDYTVNDLSSKTCRYATVRNDMYGWQESTTYGAEGWAWYDNGNVLLVAKYNNNSMEWSLLKSISDSSSKKLRFGGAGRWKLGDPEGAASLAAGKSFTFGVTRYTAIDGSWQQAYTAFKVFTESKGHICPAGWNPPIHWNELYDNPLWWPPLGDSPENRAKYYRLADMQAEAAKAAEIGCECLYLDPGWDTNFGSTIWASDRLGAQQDFITMLKNSYGLNYLALHTPLAPWQDGSTYPNICMGSTQYNDTKAARLIQNCKDGAHFLMFDGSWFENCSNPNHGHSVPLTRQEHVDAILRLQQRVHAAYPNVLIEQHDPITGPGTPRYTPTYFMHAKPGAFNELWGFEYMVVPMDDILNKKAYSLYYFNMAYSMPVYLHIDLRKDNNQAMMFWWYASTCRHLGIGGKSADASIWNAQKAAMVTYKQNKRFFTQGVFYGLDETIHAHTLADQNQCLINCFNVTTAAEQKVARFKLSDIGIPQGMIQVENASYTLEGDEVVLTVDVPARGHKLVKISVVNDPSYGTVEGIVTANVAGYPVIAGATVQANGGASTVTGNDGKYIMYLPAGTYTLTASIAGCPAQPANITVQAQQTTTQNFNLTAAVLRGTVTANTKQHTAIKDAKVQLLNTAYSKTTGANGSYYMIVPAGDYTLQASASGYSPSSASVNISYGTTQVKDFSLAQIRRWDAAEDFSATANPNGVWSCGYIPTISGSFNQFTTPFGPVLNSISGWATGSPDTYGNIDKNFSANAKDGGNGYYWEPWQLTPHPGGGMQLSVLRWTAPYDATFNISTEFRGQYYTNPGTTADVHVLRNGVSIYDAQVLGFAGNSTYAQFGTSPIATFERNLELVAGETIDFVVGPGTNGTSNGDLVGLNATIEAAATGILQGVVTSNAAGNPPVAGVLVQDSSNSTSTYTDSTGHYRLTFPDGTYTIKAAKGQSDPVVVPGVEITSDKETVQDFRISQTWDFAGDFSSSVNPNGVWTYGYGASGTNAFTPFSTTSVTQLNGLTAWYGGTSTAIIWKNTTSSGWSDGYSWVEPGYGAFHPDPTNGNRAIVRWTVPTSGAVSLKGRFTGQCFTPKLTTTRVLIQRNGSTWFDRYIDGFIGRASSNYADKSGTLPEQVFTDSRTVTAGNTYDFICYPSVSGSQFNTTGLEATFSLSSYTSVQRLSDLQSYPPGSTVQITKPVVVTVEPGVFSDGSFYVEDTDRLTGIRVYGLISAVRGRVITLKGTVGVDERGEICLTSASLVSSTATSPLGSLGTACRNIISDGPLSDILVRVWGGIKSVAPDGSWFVVNDGSSEDGTIVFLGNHSAALAAPSSDAFVAVTGVSGKQVINGILREVIQPRDINDITSY